MKTACLLIVFIFTLGCKNESDQKESLPKNQLYKASTSLDVFKPAGSELVEAVKSQEKFKSIEIKYNHGYKVEFISTNKDKQKAITELKEVIQFSKNWGADTENQRYDSASETMQNPISHSQEIEVSNVEE